MQAQELRMVAAIFKRLAASPGIVLVDYGNDPIRLWDIHTGACAMLQHAGGVFVLVMALPGGLLRRW
jgi:hypothetical protein